jgi:signal peptidase I
MATGQAALSIDNLAAFAPRATTKVRGRGSHDIVFANVDDQLLLWVDGKPVKFDQPTTYEPLGNTRPDRADLAPVGIASRGAAVRIDHLKVLRDVYYITDHLVLDQERGSGLFTDYPLDFFRLRQLTPDGMADFLSDPRQWGEFDRRRSRTFPLQPDQFLALGDNSPSSKDARVWAEEGYEFYVAREMLIGKAVAVIWPHSKDVIPGTKIWFPYFPNFARYRFVR